MKIRIRPRGPANRNRMIAFRAAGIITWVTVSNLPWVAHNPKLYAVVFLLGTPLYLLWLFWEPKFLYPVTWEEHEEYGYDIYSPFPPKYYRYKDTDTGEIVVFRNPHYEAP